MAMKRKTRGHASSIPLEIALAGIVSLVVTLLLTAVMAALINQEAMEASTMEAGAMIVTAIAAAAGALTAMQRIKKMRLQMCLAAGACYYCLLLAMTALIFGGQYAGLGSSALSILAGSGAVALLSAALQKKKNSPWRKSAYR